MGAQESIKHVVVLMLENRSFDCMLGQLYTDRPGFEGLGNPDKHQNEYQGKSYAAWNDGVHGPRSFCIPDPDPGELWFDINEQLFGKYGAPPPDASPDMSGFVKNYMRQSVSNDPKAVMHYFTPEQVPVISQLAKAFGVCDQWYASAPCQTWPNRFFVHSATCAGHVNNKDFVPPYTKETIFRRLRAHNCSFGIYYHDVPQTLTLWDMLESPQDFRLFDDFLEDAKRGKLPNYSFIEPCYGISPFFKGFPNDQHPPHNIGYGEQLIAKVYNAVRNAPTWKQTLLIITYDEHGGCFDHMPPPKAIPPDSGYTRPAEEFHANQASFIDPTGINSDNEDGQFTFSRYGVRVPAVIISPYMPPGSIVRAVEKGIQHDGPPPFDHTSIIATLRKLFDLGDPLTARDGAAPDLLEALSLTEPTNDGEGLSEIIITPVRPSMAERLKVISLPYNHMQKHLRRAVRELHAKHPVKVAIALGPKAR